MLILPCHGWRPAAVSKATEYGVCWGAGSPSSLQNSSAFQELCKAQGFNVRGDNASENHLKMVELTKILVVFWKFKRKNKNILLNVYKYRHLGGSVR